MLPPCSLITYFTSIDKWRKFSRKCPNEDTGDITYINKKNHIFNKKVERSLVFAQVGLIPFSQIARYFNKYTAEIRASFACGTKLTHCSKRPLLSRAPLRYLSSHITQSCKCSSLLYRIKIGL